MNKNMIIILGGALFVAIFAALLVQSGLSSAPEAEPVKKIQILVASENITVGTKVGSGNLAWREWPEETNFPGAIIREEGQSASDALEGRAIRTIEKGEPITNASVIRETRGNFIAASLDEGMRAFAIKVDAETAVGGFISPGDFVDVILTHKVRLPRDEDAREAAERVISESASETIVRAVKVLAIDQENKPTDEAIKFKTVTLQVTPDDAEKLALGNEMGDLSVSLRKLGETDTKDERKQPFVTDNAASKVIQTIYGSSGSADSTTPTGKTEVRVYSGNQATNVEVRVPHTNQAQE